MPELLELAGIVVKSFGILIKCTNLCLTAQKRNSDAVSSLTRCYRSVLNRVRHKLPEALAETTPIDDCSSESELLDEGVGTFRDLLGDVQTLLEGKDSSITQLLANLIDVGRKSVGSMTGPDGSSWKLNDSEYVAIEAKFRDEDPSTFRFALLLLESIKLLRYLARELDSATRKIIRDETCIRRALRVSALHKLLEAVETSTKDWHAQMDSFMVDAIDDKLDRMFTTGRRLYMTPGFVEAVEDPKLDDTTVHADVTSKVLERLRATIGCVRRTTVLTGMGGMGKSTIARRAVRHFEKVGRTVVVISGVSEEHFLNDLFEVASSLDVGLPPAVNHAFLRSVWNPLSRLGALVVVDGLDRPFDLLTTWLPGLRDAVDLLITTRSPDDGPLVSACLAPKDRVEVFSVTALNGPQSVALAGTYLDGVLPADDGEAEAIQPLMAQFAGGVPLSISLLCAVIRLFRTSPETPGESFRDTLSRVELTMKRTVDKREMVMELAVAKELSSHFRSCVLRWIRKQCETLGKFVARLMTDAESLEDLVPGSTFWQTQSFKADAGPRRQFCEWMFSPSPVDDFKVQTHVANVLYQLFRRSSLRLSITVAMEQLRPETKTFLTMTAPLDWSGVGVTRGLLQCVVGSDDQVDRALKNARAMSLVWSAPDAVGFVAQHPEIAQVIRSLYYKHAMSSDPERHSLVGIVSDRFRIRHRAHIESVCASLQRHVSPVRRSSSEEGSVAHRDLSHAVIRCLGSVDRIQRVPCKTLLTLARHFVDWDLVRTQIAPGVDDAEQPAIVQEARRALVNTLYLVTSTPFEVSPEMTTLSKFVLDVMFRLERNMRHGLYNAILPMVILTDDPRYKDVVTSALDGIGNLDRLRRSPLHCFVYAWLLSTLLKREPSGSSQQRRMAVMCLEFAKSSSEFAPTHAMLLELDSYVALELEDDKHRTRVGLEDEYRDKGVTETDLAILKSLGYANRKPVSDMTKEELLDLVDKFRAGSSGVETHTRCTALINAIIVLRKEGTTMSLDQAETLLSELRHVRSSTKELLDPMIRDFH